MKKYLSILLFLFFPNKFWSENATSLTILFVMRKSGLLEIDLSAWWFWPRLWDDIFAVSKFDAIYSTDYKHFSNGNSPFHKKKLLSNLYDLNTLSIETFRRRIGKRFD
jgi:hypothetical protein